MNADVRRRIAFVAAVLFLVSAVLQFLAARQRWLSDTSGLLSPFALEDHLYDFTFPTEPSINIGSAALLWGIGTVLLAVAMAILAFVLVPVPDPTRPVSSVRAATRTSRLLALLVGLGLLGIPTALAGIHAAVSGIAGSPSGLALVLAGGVLPGLLEVAGLCFLLVWALRRSWVTGVAVALLFGTTFIGYLAAAFAIGPMIVGYTSHDTTPWTEAVQAVCVAMTALALAVGSATHRLTRPIAEWV